MNEAASGSRRYGCPSCGGGLRYDIASREMICDRCGSMTKITDLPQEEAGDLLEVTEFHCPQCGAAVYSTDTEVTSFCSFCGSDVVLMGKMARTKRPAKIVPFTVTREECERAYHDHLGKYLLAPREMKKAETLAHFRPVYVPFWSYQVDAEGPASLEGKKSYTRGNYRYDETYDLSMDAEIRQKGILYDASTAFEDETAAMLRHTTEDAVPFHPAYLSGFYAQGSDVEASTYEQEAAASAVKMFMEQVKEDTGMDSVEMKGNIEDNFGLPGARFREELVMMPVWLLAHRQGERVVYTAINGKSGETVCDVPVSSGRMISMTLGLAAALFLVLSFFLTLKPETLMAICAVITVVVQYLFSGAQEMLYTRRSRIFEPDFDSGENSFTGAAKAQLQVRENRVSASGSDRSAKAQRALATIIGVIIFLAFAVGGNLTRIMSSISFGSSGFRRGAVLAVVLICTVVLIIHTIRRLGREKKGPWWPRALCCLACCAGLFFLATKQIEDLLFYGCAAAMLISSGLELLMVNLAHNEYASRPVPFFEEKEETI